MALGWSQRQASRELKRNLCAPTASPSAGSRQTGTCGTHMLNSVKQLHPVEKHAPWCRKRGLTQLAHADCKNEWRELTPTAAGNSCGAAHRALVCAVVTRRSRFVEQ